MLRTELPTLPLGADLAAGVRANPFATARVPATNLQKVVAVALAPMVAVTLALGLGSDHLRWPVASALYWAYLVAGSAGVGLYWWRRRPASRFGPLLVVFSFGVWIVSWENANAALPFSLGVLAEGPFFLMSIYLFLAFPMGRLDRAGRWLIGALWFVMLVFFVPAILLRAQISPSSPLSRCVTACPDNALQVGSNADLALKFLKAETYTVLAIVAATFAIYLRRVLTASAPQRRALAAVGITSLLFLPAFFVSNFSAWVLELDPTTLDTLSWFVAATRVLLPVGFLLALLLAELRASAVQLALLEHLVTRPTPQQWRGAIAGVLDDAELRIGYRDPASDAFLEPDGGRLPEPGEGCARVPIDHDGEAVAAMVLDETLAEDPELVGASATATLVAIQNGALEGELRARVVQAGHVERLRIERDIHDSAQQRLAALRVHLALAGERVASSEDRAMLRRLNSEVELAIEELRDATHGKVPAVLAERGLAAALEGVASASPIPVRVEADGLRRHSEALETAIFFCCLECLQNATKHAGPQATVGVRLAERDGEVSFTVRDDGAGFDAGAVRSGAGLSNLADRVEALGGTLEVDARPGRGTRVTGRFPAGAERA